MAIARFLFSARLHPPPISPRTNTGAAKCILEAIHYHYSNDDISILEYKMLESPDYPEFELVRDSLGFLVKEGRSRILAKCKRERERSSEFPYNRE